mgnify:CR=1 FL=1
MTNLTEAPRRPFQTFLDFPLQTDLDAVEADVAIIGLPYGAPYSMAEVTNDQSNAPAAVRRASARMIQSIARHDFDVGGPILAGRDIRVVDVGDVIADPWDMHSHYRRAEQAARIPVHTRPAILALANKALGQFNRRRSPSGRNKSLRFYRR